VVGFVVAVGPAQEVGLPGLRGLLVTEALAKVRPGFEVLHVRKTKLCSETKLARLRKIQ
jgi:hypothetical protein